MASAFVVGPSPGTQAAFAWRTDGGLHGAIKLQWAPPTGAAPRRWWERSQEALLIRFDLNLQAQVMGEIGKNATLVCGEAMRRAEMSLEELDVFITHQPMRWQVPFTEDVLGLAEGIAFDTFEEYANINSASLTASIHHARLEGRLRKGTKALLFGPAAGYTYAAAVIRW